MKWKNSLIPTTLGAFLMLLSACDSSTLEYDPAKEAPAAKPAEKAPASAPTEAPAPKEAAPAEEKPPAPERSETPVAPSAPAAPAVVAGEACVTVNGVPVPTAKLMDMLMASYGMRFSQHLIAEEVVRQEFKKRSLSYAVTPAQRQQETRRALGRKFPVDMKTPWRQVEDILQPYIAREGISRAEWDMSMDRNVRLRRMAEKDTKVTDEDLKKAYRIFYDGKIICRHIRTPDLPTAQKAVDAVKKGKTFAEAAAIYSTNPSGKKQYGGFLPAIGTKTNPNSLPPAIVEVARSLTEKGQISNPVKVGTNFHLIYLEDIRPAEIVPFEKAKEQLRPLVREEKIAQQQLILLGDLLKKADIQYTHPVLKAQRRQIQRDSRLDE